MIWETVEGGLAAKFPNVKIFAAEYGGAIREINDVIYNLPNRSGLGTFFWEATMANSSWNNGALVTQSGSTYTATPDLSLYDKMKTDYADRL
jgi:arabinogalactan endo-1,4-beta-galactosidase